MGIHKSSKKFAVVSSAVTLSKDSSSLAAFCVVPRLLRIQDAAKYLSATTWYVETLIRENKIPSFIQGKRRVIDRHELDRYVDRMNAESVSKRSIDLVA